MSKPRTQQIMDFLRENPTASNKEIAKAIGWDVDNTTNTISTLNVRGWINSKRKDGERQIEVVWEPKERQTVKEFKQDVYYDMLPKAIETYEEATSVDELNVAAKIIFRILENI
ncbi:MarR family winged helix-turn-helix transcriptional regulator [Hutsoniella sourekii]|uniref:MarR family winged helix-turn-helix transcriptional regulator n=1 Tax=Hutsoniella sourekii TaxID=87650 RepID=UPI0004877DD4|nr:MarR family winged helix-turn-helix transcriptional regulator [Hutsoniella sourekii]